MTTRLAPLGNNRIATLVFEPSRFFHGGRRAEHQTPGRLVADGVKKFAGRGIVTDLIARCAQQSCKSSSRRQVVIDNEYAAPRLHLS